MPDLTQEIKTAILGRLDNAAPLVAIVPRERIFPSTPPTLPEVPFVRLGYTDSEPYEDSCGSGSTSDFTVNAFVATESETGAISKALYDALDNDDLFLSCDVERMSVVYEQNGGGNGHPLWRVMLAISATMTQ